MNKYTLITGASSGIGLELAKIFAQNKNNLILAARSLDKLEQISKEFKEKYNVEIICIQKDLSQPDSAKELYEEIKKQNLEVENLVNNAGFATSGKFWEIDYSKDIEEINLNILALTNLTKLFAANMVARNSGRILNLASTAAFEPGPFMAVYYASKAYVLSFTEAISNELKDTKISVTALCPGPTVTNFADRAEMSNSKLFNAGGMNAETVAKIGYKAMMKGKRTVVAGIFNKITSIVIQFMPKSLVLNVIRRLQEK